jgi:hypothetical protein
MLDDYFSREEAEAFAARLTDLEDNKPRQNIVYVSAE